MQNTVIQITNNGMGKGDQALQHKLIAKYLEILQMNESLPNAITTIRTASDWWWKVHPHWNSPVRCKAKA